MARPNKQGVDYFPLDVHLDDKFKFIEIKYKLEGFAVIIKLIQKIYSYGYWYKWTEDEALLFADEIRADIDLVNSVVNESLDRGIFNKELHNKYNILTSTGIQKRYKEIVRRRKDVEVTEEYLLIDDIVTTYGQHNDGIVTSPSKQESVKSTQTETESKQKGKESKENNYTTEFESFWKDYPKKADKPYAFTKFKASVKKHGLEKVMTGLKGYIEVTKDEDKQYIKNPGTFLNKGSYLDFLEVEEEEPITVKVTEEQRIRYRMNELSGDLSLGEKYFKDKGKVGEYHAAVKEYDELERQLQSYKS